MGYQSEGIAVQKAKLDLKMRDQRHAAQEAMEAFETARMEEAAAKKKRGFWGGALGSLVGAAVFGFTGIPLWAIAGGAAVGKGLGEYAYEEGWGDWAGSHSQDMEETLAALELLEEQSQFASVREGLEEYNIAADIAVREFDEGLDIIEMGTDALKYYTALSGIKKGATKVGDLFGNIVSGGVDPVPGKGYGLPTVTAD